LKYTLWRSQWLQNLNNDDWLKRGSSLLKDGDLDSALRCYERSLGICPDNLDLLKRRGILLGMMGRYFEAIDSLKAAIRKDPRNGELWLLKGFMLLRLLRYDEAKICFERCALFSPGDVCALYMRDVVQSERNARKRR